MSQELEDLFTDAVFRVIYASALIIPLAMLIRTIIDTTLIGEASKWEYFDDWS